MQRIEAAPLSVRWTGERGTHATRSFGISRFVPLVTTCWDRYGRSAGPPAINARTRF